MTPVHNVEMVKKLAELRHKAINVLKLSGEDFQAPAFLGAYRWCSVYNNEVLKVIVSLALF